MWTFPIKSVELLKAYKISPLLQRRKRRVEPIKKTAEGRSCVIGYSQAKIEKGIFVDLKV